MSEVPHGFVAWHVPHLPEAVQIKFFMERRKHKRIEIWRSEWDAPKEVAQDDLPPWMNVAGLYWRPAKSPGGTNPAGADGAQ